MKGPYEVAYMAFASLARTLAYYEDAPMYTSNSEKLQNFSKT